MRNGGWKLLPPNAKINYFVDKNLYPLPAQPSKKIYAAFFICPEESTLVTTRVGFCLQPGSFRGAKTLLTSLQNFRLVITKNKVRKMEEQNTVVFGVFLNYTVKKKVRLVFYGNEFKLKAKFWLKSKIHLHKISIFKVFLVFVLILLGYNSCF